MISTMAKSFHQDWSVVNLSGPTGLSIQSSWFQVVIATPIRVLTRYFADCLYILLWTSVWNIGKKLEVFIPVRLGMNAENYLRKLINPGLVNFSMTLGYEVVQWLLGELCSKFECLTRNIGVIVIFAVLRVGSGQHIRARGDPRPLNHAAHTAPRVSLTSHRHGLSRRQLWGRELTNSGSWLTNMIST